MNAPSDSPALETRSTRPDRVRMTEWSSRLLEGVFLGDTERARLEQLERHRPSALDWDELRRGLRLETRAHVGAVHFADTTVCIEPSLAGGADTLLEMIDYGAGLEALDRRSARTIEVDDGAHLLDLVGVRLAEETRALLRRGLLTGYVEREDDLAVLRGRLKPREQYLERFGAFDRLHCRFDDRSRDTWENRLLAAGLKACVRHADDANLRDEARRLHRRVARTCRPDQLELEGLDRRVHHRGNAHYREAHTYARLLIRGLGLGDVDEGGDVEVDPFLIDMNRLFERCLERSARETLSGDRWRVTSQHVESGAIADARTGEPRRDVRPDLLLTSRSNPSLRLPVDAKYKSLQGRPPMSDVRQAVTYAQIFGREASDGPDAALVYPAERRCREHLALQRPTGHHAVEIAVCGWPIADVLEGGCDADTRRVGWRSLTNACEEAT